MRQRQRLFLGATLVALLAAAPAAMAQGGGPRPDGGPRHFGGPGREGAARLFEYLGLSEEQRQAWMDAQRSNLEAQRPTFQQLRTLRQQIHDELESGSPDPTTVGSYMIQIHDLEADLRASRQDLEAAIESILTDEQELKLEAWKAAHPERGPGGPHRGPRPDGDSSAEPGA